MVVNILVGIKGFEYVKGLVGFENFWDRFIAKNGEEIGCTYHRVKVND